VFLFGKGELVDGLEQVEVIGGETITVENVSDKW
jgi:hypothetical protein